MVSGDTNPTGILSVIIVDAITLLGKRIMVQREMQH